MVSASPLQFCDGKDEEQKIDESRDASIRYSLHYSDKVPASGVVSKRGKEDTELFSQLRSIISAGPVEKGFGASQRDIKDSGFGQPELKNKETKNSFFILGQLLARSDRKGDKNVNEGEVHSTVPGERVEKESRVFQPFREKTKSLQRGLRTMVSNPPPLNGSTGTSKGSTFLLETLDSDYGLFGQNLLPPIPFYWTGAPIRSSPRRVVIMFADVYGMNSGNHKMVADAIADLLDRKKTAVMIPDLSRGNPLLQPHTNLSTAALGAMLVRLKLKNRPERIERDLTEMLFPWLASQFEDVSKVSFSCVGFCHGAWIMARALALKNSLFECGVGIHPSFMAEEVQGGSSENLAEKIGSVPCLLLPASNDQDLKAFSKPSLVLAKSRGVKMGEVVKDFDTMSHGWVTRGDSSDKAIAKKQEEAVEAVTSFILRYSN
mmetsp:Transcript_10191/g.15559  ORF Transcript_10191/g.15559 Transcript_10191/m.15559 type:complete len:433 (+) Transcript_10191:55-1353(+)|eukprot:CAMPEP_0194205970 /NCGR_PEP_ID=MMETSP0156-20130528/5118_1 /TAXON_ID=33649 /ORGANISM="Thalassionema nitzschioides, Strain L26-B" /LENGTH=432 /DNA_ID=CAMNT_0038932377 /DNA_START=27 /DNA_END=1325 /DNA_ORIENTATION=-